LNNYLIISEYICLFVCFIESIIELFHFQYSGMYYIYTYIIIFFYLLFSVLAVYPPVR